MLLVKDPSAVPSSEQVPPTTGFSDVLQQTPSAVIAAPPSEVTVPPLLAVVSVIPETAVVVTVGRVTVDRPVEKKIKIPLLFVKSSPTIQPSVEEMNSMPESPQSE